MDGGFEEIFGFQGVLDVREVWTCAGVVLSPGLRLACQRDNLYSHDATVRFESILTGIRAVAFASTFLTHDHSS